MEEWVARVGAVLGQADRRPGRQTGRQGAHCGRSWRVYWGLLDWACASGGCVIRTRIPTCLSEEKRGAGARTSLGMLSPLVMITRGPGRLQRNIPRTE